VASGEWYQNGLADEELLLLKPVEEAVTEVWEDLAEIQDMKDDRTQVLCI